ncbi:UDP-galactopyranose mutase, partial [Escherichia coli]
LIVGSGLFGSVFAFEANKRGYSVKVIEKRNHLGGNVYCENVAGINVHKYGAHIFHTNDKKIWDYVNELVEFNNFINSPVALSKGQLYNLPFNMNTFYKMWGVISPDAAKKIISEQSLEITSEPCNLEEQAISLVGRDIYETLIKEYTEKQWGRSC